DGIVVRRKAYGIPSIQVDGNDTLAICSAALTYRAGHHSTSDDSTMYRTVEEIEWWRHDQNPVKIFKKWFGNKGWWSNEAESQHQNIIRKQPKQFKLQSG
ncbi:hypothetical protein M8C21_022575, partial [Ambrosia artemisiifolia]